MKIPRLPPQVRGARAAIVFLTRVPVGGFPYSRSDWAWSSAYFPLVGAAIGAVMAAVFLLLEPLGAWPAALLCVTVSLFITGGFHEDGLADTCDALGGGYDRDRVLEILKDPRVGTFGAVALVVSVGLRVAFIAQLAAIDPWLLVFVQSASRMPPIWLMVFLPYATPSGTARSRDVARADGPQAVLATVWPAIAAGYVLVQSAAVATAAASIAVTALLGWRFHARVGGITGDFLGATQQVLEVVLLAILVWLL